MRKILVVLGLLLAFSVVHAEEKKKMYKYTDDEGVTHYSEIKLNDDYKEADLPALSIVPSAPVTQSTTTTSGSKEEDVDPSQVETFSIIAPTSEQNLWGTGGKLTAQVSPLTAAQQEMYLVQFIVDDKKHKPANTSTQVFEEVFRGEHTVKALLIHKYNKKVIKESQTVTFFMHQNSKK